MKFCYPPAESDMFIYINPGATVGDNIYASSTLAVTFDTHDDVIGAIHSPPIEGGMK